MNILTNHEQLLAANNYLIALRVSKWTAAKKDKKSEEKVASDARATTRKATSVRKHLFAENKHLDNIHSLTSRARAYVDIFTKPWDDDGRRFITGTMFFDAKFTAKLSEFEAEYLRLVDTFIYHYDIEVTNMAFKLGDLFDRSEYPSKDEVRSKFAWRLVIEPVPVSGHIITTAASSAASTVIAMLAKENEDRLERLVSDGYTRIKDQVDSLITKLSDGQRFYESTFEAAEQLVEALGALNFTNDARIERARTNLKQVLAGYGATPSAVREAASDKKTRASMAEDLRKMREQFDF